MIFINQTKKKRKIRINKKIIKKCNKNYKKSVQNKFQKCFFSSFQHQISQNLQNKSYPRILCTSLFMSSFNSYKWSFGFRNGCRYCFISVIIWSTRRLNMQWTTIIDFVECICIEGGCITCISIVPMRSLTWSWSKYRKKWRH